jgi:outer membrane protein
LLQHQKQLEQEFGKKQTAFENEAAAFQRKVQANSFLSLESAQQQEAELYQKQQQLMNLKDDLSAKLMEQEQAMTKQIHDSIVNCVNIFNKSNKYKLILSNTFGGTIIYGDSTLNLTDTIQSILNSRFPKKK